jgi:hypothetical protein
MDNGGALSKFLPFVQLRPLRGKAAGGLIFSQSLLFYAA